jgi:signal transduction histidine kinase
MASGVISMTWDLGIRGVGLLLGMALGFGLLAQLAFYRSAPKWLWAVGTTVYFLSGLFISEVWFGWATEEDLQPNIDGLSFDEVLLIAFIPWLVAVLAARRLMRRQRHGRHAGHGRQHPAT